MGPLAWTGIGLGVVAIGLVLGLVVLRVTVFVNSGGAATNAASCQQAVPAGVSPAAAAYLEALNTAYVGWTQVSRSLRNEHEVVHEDDLLNEEVTDGAFLAKIERIHFTGAVAEMGTAPLYIQVIRDYIQQLGTAINEYGYYAGDHQQFVQDDASRSALAAQMRQELDLPPGRCAVLRP